MEDSTQWLYITKLFSPAEGDIYSALGLTDSHTCMHNTYTQKCTNTCRTLIIVCINREAQSTVEKSGISHSFVFAPALRNVLSALLASPIDAEMPQVAPPPPCLNLNLCRLPSALPVRCDRAQTVKGS